MLDMKVWWECTPNFREKNARKRAASRHYIVDGTRFTCHGGWPVILPLLHFVGMK
jgi:transcriptional regulator GlxA family with amidase domain